jgi:hypothetical protein
MNQTFDCSANTYAGVIFCLVSIRGESGNVVVGATPIAAIISLSGSVPESGFVESTIIQITVTILGNVQIVTASNWVAWSKIGQINFDMDLTGDSGQIPMPWQGIVYQIKQLEKNAVVYGSGGITMLLPVSKPLPTYGMQDLPFGGIYNPTAVCGDTKKHFFVDTQLQLWQLTEAQPLHIQHYGGPKLLNFSEYISALNSDFTMHYDQTNERCYISDSVQGLAYIKAQGMGGGYGNMTGFQWNNGEILVTSPSGLILPTQELCTDIIDLQTRDIKLLGVIEIGCDAVNSLYVAVDYRYDKSQPFQTSQWYLLNSQGYAFPTIAGTELRVRVKNLVYEYIQFSYMNLHFKFIDRRATRSQRMVKRGLKASA